MKKLSRAIIAVMLCVTLCFTAVACGDPEGGGDVTPTEYTVTYALDGGSGTLPTETAKKAGEKFALASGDGLTKDKHSFDGWNDGTTKYAAGAEYTMPAKNVTFTAVWKADGQTPDPQPPATYTVTYALDGGSGTLPTETAKEAGEKFALASGDGLTKDKHSFDGWSDGTTKYAAGAEYTMPASNVTFTAVWELDLPSGACKFTGSYTTPDHSGMLPLPGGTIVEIYIDFENDAVSYKLSTGELKSVAELDTVKSPNDNKFRPDNYGEDALYYEVKMQSVTYYLLVKADFSKVWICDQNDEPIVGAEFVRDNGAEAATYTVTYDLNGGTGTVPTETAKAQGAKFELASATGFTKEGHIFDGWSDGTTKYAAGARYTMPASNITFTAQWLDESEITRYTVTYVKPDGVTGDVPETVTVDEGTQVTLAPADQFAKEGWTFQNWSVSTYPALRAPNTKITVNANTTITPVFAQSYTGDLEIIKILDNGTLVHDGYTYSFTKNGDILTVTDFFVTYIKLNESAKTYTVSDDMESFEFTATDGTKLTFDGFGVAMLGTHKGTYALNDQGSAITLVFGDNTYTDIAFAGAYPNLIINVTINVDGTDYVFGNGGATGPENPEPSDDKLADYVGATSSTAVVYGYASVADAESANNTISATNSANAERTFYQAKVYKNYSNKLLITIQANVGSVSTVKDGQGQDIIIADDTPNQTIYVTSASYANQFIVTFSKDSEGKRVMTVKYGDTTVTWVEITA